MSATYHILDEPTGRNASQFVMNPFWPLLAMMLGGAWLGCLLFALNAWFMRGPTWLRELVLIAIALLGSPLILYGIAAANDHGLLADQWIKYAFLLIVVWKIALMYWIFFLQQSAHALYEYFASSRIPSNKFPVGVALLGAGFFFKSQVVAAFASPFWRVMVN